MLEMVVTPARANEAPSVRFNFADYITRILPHRAPRSRPKDL